MESAAIASSYATAASYNPLSGLIKAGQAGTLPAIHNALEGGTGPTLPSFKAAAPPPPAGGLAAPGGSSTPGPMTPDQWKALISADPGLQMITSQLSAGDVSNQGARNAGIEQALAAFGGPVDLNAIAKQLGLSANDLSSLDPKEIQQLAQEADQSGVSTNARLNHANAQALRQIKNSLAARGLLHSSELNYELGEQNQNFQNAQFDARQKLLNALQQYQQGYLAYKAQIAQQLAQGVNDATNRVVSQNAGLTGGGSSAPPPASPPPASSPPSSPPVALPRRTAAAGAGGVGSLLSFT